MQMTTREAVEMALSALSREMSQKVFFQDDTSKDRSAIVLLCEHYGFKSEQFFDAKEPA